MRLIRLLLGFIRVCAVTQMCFDILAWLVAAVKEGPAVLQDRCGFRVQGAVSCIA